MEEDDSFTLCIYTTSGEHICDLDLDADQHGALLGLGLKQLLTEEMERRSADKQEEG